MERHLNKPVRQEKLGRRRRRIAVVVMPWTPAHIAPFQPASLRSLLAARGHKVDVCYLNLLMEARIGRLQTALSAHAASYRTWAEWPFAHRLFGPAGLGELEKTPLESPDESFRQFLSKTGASVERMQRLVDEDVPGFLKQCLETVPWARYDQVFFADVFSSHTACLALSWAIKRRWPEKVVALFGPNVEAEQGEEALKACGWLDAAFGHDHEHGLLALADGGDLPRALAANKRAKDLDALPAPDHGDYYRWLRLSKMEGRLEPVLTFEASRGCWWAEKQHCTFCGLNGQEVSFRTRTARRVLEDIRSLQRRHRPLYLQASDTILGLEHLRTLLPLLGKARAKAARPWHIFWEIKANLSEEQIRLMAEAGVLSVQVGLESFSTPVLRRCRKGVSGLQNVQTLKLLALHGIAPTWNLGYGFSGETEADHRTNLSLMPLLLHLPPPASVGAIRAARWSPYHFDAPSLLKNKPRIEAACEFIYPSSRFELEKVANYFDLDEGRDPAAQELIEKIKAAGVFWQRLHPFCRLRCEDGPGASMTIHDSRPPAFGAPPKPRRYVLPPLPSACLKAARTIAHRNVVLDACRKVEPQVDAARVRAALEELTAQGLILEEDGCYLSLAMPD